MTATPEAMSPAAEQYPLASPDPRRGLIFVAAFVAICLVLAGIAFLPAMPTDVAPFVLSLSGRWSWRWDWPWWRATAPWRGWGGRCSP